MKISLCLTILLIIIYGCTQDITSPKADYNEDKTDGILKVSLNMSDAPEDVVFLAGRLEKPFHWGSEIFFDFEINDTIATAYVDNIPSGDWVLTVDAYDINSFVIYTGTIDVKVYPGIITPVSIHLNSNTGGIEINATWGKMKRIAYVYNGQIYIMNINGTNNVNLTKNDGNNSFPVFSPNGSKIAYWSSKEIYIMNSDGSNQRNLTNRPVNFNIYGYDQPVFSPDGSKIAFPSDRDGNREIYLMNLDGSEQTNLTNNSGYDLDPAFSPDGSKIAFRSDRGDNDREIYIMNVDGSEQNNLTNNGIDDDDPSFSPDGSKIVYHSNNNISVMNIDGSGKTVLSAGYSPVFSPVESVIAFMIGNPSDIYIINIDGSGKTKLSNSSEWDGEPIISLDGTKIVFRSDRENKIPNLYIMNIDGSEQMKLIGPDAYCPVFQPGY